LRGPSFLFMFTCLVSFCASGRPKILEKLCRYHLVPPSHQARFFCPLQSFPHEPRVDGFPMSPLQRPSRHRTLLSFSWAMLSWIPPLLPVRLPVYSSCLSYLASLFTLPLSNSFLSRQSFRLRLPLDIPFNGPTNSSHVLLFSSPGSPTHHFFPLAFFSTADLVNAVHFLGFVEVL